MYGDTRVSLTKIIGKHLESLTIMGISLIVGGIVMWLVDAMYERSNHKAFLRGGRLIEDMEDMSIGQAVWIGLCQIFSAVFPGTSRSMSTITGGELAGMSRPAALEFSFFLSIPTMVVATVYDFYKSMRPHHGQPSAIGTMPTDAHSLDRAGDRIRRVVHRGLRRGGVVYELGAHARFRSVRGISDCRGSCGAVVVWAVGVSFLRIGPPRFVIVSAGGAFFAAESKDLRFVGGGKAPSAAGKPQILRLRSSATPPHSAQDDNF